MSFLSPSNPFTVLVGCLWCVTAKTLVLVDVCSCRLCPHAYCLPLSSDSPWVYLSLWWCSLAPAVFHSMQKQLRDHVRNLGDLPCCCESTVQSFTIGEAGG